MMPTIMRNKALGAALGLLALLTAFTGVCLAQDVENLKERVFVPRPATREITLTGFTRPRAAMTLVSEESGRCLEVMADVGDVIAPDGVFAKLDDAFVILDLQKNKAEQQRLVADVKFYESEVRRYQQLVSKDSVAVRDLEEDVRVLEGAKNSLAALRIEERILLEHLSRFVLRAPPGWLVIERYLEPGEWVKSGDKAAELGRFDRLLVPFALTVSELSAVRAMKGKLWLRLTDFDLQVPADIERIAPDFDPETRKINVDLAMDNQDRKLRGGLRAELVISMPDAGGALLAPRESLVKAYEEYFLVRPDGERVRATLLGDAPEGQVRIRLDGMKPGEAFLAHPGV